MMATTHALVGVLLGSASLFVAPELAPVAVFAGFAGGVFPDFDLYSGHRKTLHYPVYFSIAAAAALAIAAVAPNPWTFGVAFFLLAAAVHSVSDAFGGGWNSNRGSGSPNVQCTTTSSAGGFLHVAGFATTARPRISPSELRSHCPVSSSTTGRFER